MTNDAPPERLPQLSLAALKAAKFIDNRGRLTVPTKKLGIKDMAKDIEPLSPDAKKLFEKTEKA